MAEWEDYSREMRDRIMDGWIVTSDRSYRMEVDQWDDCSRSAAFFLIRYIKHRIKLRIGLTNG